MHLISVVPQYVDMHRRLPSRLALSILVAVALLSAAPAADARMGPCVLGQKQPKCHIVPAKVGPVHDGDTFRARFKGSGGLRLVRMNGIQAMELDKYGRRAGREGECNAIEAVEALDKMIRHRRVRLVAQDLSSVTEGDRNRLRRTVQVKRDGRWIDPGMELLKLGLVLWFPNGGEWAWNRTYRLLAAEAAQKGIGIWNPIACGDGPDQDIPLTMKLKWDAEGVDSKNINGEFARIRNLDPTRDLSLAGWWFRDSHLRPRVNFGSGDVIPAGEAIRVRVGRGRDTADTFHWNLGESVWENVIGGKRAMGDGGYLFDPKGDLRAYVQYPCVISCRDPAKNRVAIRAGYRGDEYIVVRNISQTPLDLTEYEIESVPYFYEFSFGTILDPGQALILYIGKGPARRGVIVKNWGFKKGLLADRRDVVTLRNRLGAPVVCDAWGKEKGKKLECPRV